MTRSEFVSTMLRRWYFLLGGLLCTFLAIGYFGVAPGVYSTQVDVVFLPPSEGVRGNPLEGRSDSLIYFAAIVEREVNDGANLTRPSASATLYGSGIRSGYLVSLPNTGGQWRTNFGRPVLSVEVVDLDEANVTKVLNEQLAKVNDTVRRIQDEQGVAPENRIQTGLAPSVPVVTYVGGSRMRAALGITAIGIALSVLITIGLDRILSSSEGVGSQFKRRLASSAPR